MCKTLQPDSAEGKLGGAIIQAHKPTYKASYVILTQTQPLPRSWETKLSSLIMLSAVMTY